jgi:hypothetical protein
LTFPLLDAGKKRPLTHIRTMGPKISRDKLLILTWMNDAKTSVCYNQSHYIEVAQGAISIEQKLDFGLVMGQLAILKKKLGPIMSIFWGCFFHVFVGSLAFALKSCMISFLYEKTIWIFKNNVWAQNM